MEYSILFDLAKFVFVGFILYCLLILAPFIYFGQKRYIEISKDCSSLGGVLVVQRRGSDICYRGSDVIKPY